jgi:hypothetical protein
MTSQKKPNPRIRGQTLLQDIIFVGKDDIKYKKTKTLKALEKYYEGLLEMLAGKQVWDILESLQHVEHELHTRQSQQPNKE